MTPDLRLEWTMSSSEEEVLKEVLEALRTIRYGSVQIVLQDGKIVQIEKVEKVRFSR